MPRLTKEEKEKIRIEQEKKEAELRKRLRIRDDIIAIVIIAVGLFLVLSLLTASTGTIGNSVRRCLFGLFGFVAYIIPFFLIVIGVMMIAQKTAFVSLRTSLSVFFFIVLLTCLVANFKEPLKSINPYNFSISLQNIYNMGAESGGVVGVYAGGFIRNYIGQTGLYIVCGVGLIVTLLMIFDTPLSALLDKIKLKRQALKEARAEREEQLKIETALAEKEAQKKAEASIIPDKEPVIIEPSAEIKQPSEEIKKEIPEIKIEQPELSLKPLEEMIPEETQEEVPARVFTPEDIGLKSVNKDSDQDMPENRKQIIGYVTEDALYGIEGGSGKSHGNGLKSTVEAFAETSQDGSFLNVTIDDISTTEIPKESEKEEVYKFPPISLLKKPSGLRGSDKGPNMEDQSEVLEETLHSFGVSASVIDVIKGPAVTRFEVQPAPGVKVSSIARLHDDLALNLKAKSLRIEAPIPGKAAVGIEVSNDTISTVTLREILESNEFKKHKSKIAVGIGRSIGGESIVANLKDMPHLLVAGATGSGKSVCINSMIVSILYKATPDEVKMILIDPKVVELSNYNGIPHLMIPVVTEPAKAAGALGWAVAEMNDRYNKFADEGVRDLESYNESVRANGENQKVLPQIVIIIDELAELIMTAKNSVEDSICRLAQKARAAGMHLIVATQRPSVDIITGVIKANIPSRIAFAVSSAVDSRTILDMAGAESLLGKGDMLYSPQGVSKPIRVQGSYISDSEVNAVIDFLKKDNSQIQYNNDIVAAMNSVGQPGVPQQQDDGEDDLLTDAIEMVVRAEQCSVSMLQRRFRIGYNRAARLVDLMEERGIVGPADGSRPRKVNMTVAEFENLTSQLTDPVVEEEIL